MHRCVNHLIFSIYSLREVLHFYVALMHITPSQQGGRLLLAWAGSEEQGGGMGRDPQGQAAGRALHSSSEIVTEINAHLRWERAKPAILAPHRAISEGCEENSFK